MTPDLIFQVCGLLALIGWLLLIFGVFPRRLRELAPRVIAGGLIPALIACVYLAVMVTHWGEHKGGFNSLSDVTLLFTDRWLVLAGWIHYLAFDLFIGSWEVCEAQRLKIPHLIVIPCLLLTFMFGPVGWLCFYMLRLVYLRRSQSQIGS